MLEGGSLRRLEPAQKPSVVGVGLLVQRLEKDIDEQSRRTELAQKPPAGGVGLSVEPLAKDIVQ